VQSSFLSQYIVYRCVVGSQAYGLAEAGSDVDRRGFFVPPAEQHWSLASVPEQIVDDGHKNVTGKCRNF
jgi:hypothetical protein